MKKILSWSLLLFLFLLSFSSSEILMIKVQSTALRSEPRFFASIKKFLKFGDQIEKLTSQEGWFQVKTFDGHLGWVHSSAVQLRPIRLASLAQGPKTTAGASEVALASKGFNRQVEAAYQQRHPEINYSWVDRMLSFKIEETTIEKFLRDGQLGNWKETK